MVISKGKLSSAEKKTAIDWLDKKGAGSPSCPGCQHTEWMIADHLVAAPIHNGKSMMLGGTAYPNFMIICKNCGNTQFFNAVLSGVVAEEPPSDDASQGSDDG